MGRLTAKEQEAIYALLPKARTCTKCGQEKEQHNFTPFFCRKQAHLAARGWYLRSRCHACERERMAAERQDPLFRAAEAVKRRRYRASPEGKDAHRARYMRPDQKRQTKMRVRAYQKQVRLALAARIPDVLAQVYGVSTYDDIPYPAEARFALIWLLKATARLHADEIAAYLGIHRTTVIHHVTEIRKRLEWDEELGWVCAAARVRLGKTRAGERPLDNRISVRRTYRKTRAHDIETRVPKKGMSYVT